MPYLRTRDITLFYDRQGQGSPVLLIMGYGMPGRFWASQIEALSARHEVIWFDNRGAGRTQAKPGAYTIKQMAEDAAALITHLGYASVHVAGVSMGGMIAQELALTHRAKVRSLALIATHAGGWLTGLPSRRGLTLFAKASVGSRAKRSEAFQRLIFPEHYLNQADNAGITDLLRTKVMGELPQGGRWSQLAAVVRHRTRRRLEQLRGIPTLVVLGSEDLLVRPATTRAVHKAIPGAQLRVYQGAGHGLLSQSADRLNADLITLFQGTDHSG